MKHSRTAIVQARVPVEARDWLAEQAWQQRRRSPGAVLRVLVETAMEGEAEALRGALTAVKTLAAREVLRARQARADPGAWGDVLRLCAPAARPRGAAVEGVERCSPVDAESLPAGPCCDTEDGPGPVIYHRPGCTRVRP